MSASRNGPRSRSISSSSCSASSSVSRSRTGTRRELIASAPTGTSNEFATISRPTSSVIAIVWNSGPRSPRPAPRGLAYAETGDAGGATQWDLLRAYFWASQVGAFNLTEATYDELRSAGELGLLGDPRLRDQLASYYTNSKNPTLSESPEYRKHVRGLIPLDIQLYLWEKCWQSEMSGKQRALDCSSPVDEVRARAVVDTIRNDMSLMRELRYWMSTMRVAGDVGRIYRFVSRNRGPAPARAVCQVHEIARVRQCGSCDSRRLFSS